MIKEKKQMNKKVPVISPKILAQTQIKFPKNKKKIRILIKVMYIY